MQKRLSVFLTVFSLLFIIPTVIYFFTTSEAVFTYSQSMDVNKSKVEYQLPYSGILPDNPLYLLKRIRDKLLILMTRDLIKKSELLLLLSDKQAVMSVSLAKKGKEKLAVKTINEGEKYFLKLLRVLKKAKEQGKTPSGEFILKLKLSNQKHQEIIQSLSVLLPQGQSDLLSKALEINRKIYQELDKF